MLRPDMDVTAFFLLAFLAGPCLHLFVPDLFPASGLVFLGADVGAIKSLNVCNQFFSSYTSLCTAIILLPSKTWLAMAST